MEITKNKIFHLVLGCASLVMLVLSILLVGQVIATPTSMTWVWAVMVICYAISLIEMVVYFLFGNTDISLMLCKWLNVFIGIVLLIANTLGLILGGGAIFGDFSQGWASFLAIILSYVVTAMMFLYFIFAIKDSKTQKAKED